MLVDLIRLEREYYVHKPHTGERLSSSSSAPADTGSSLIGSFTEAHIAAITQAICDYRRGHGIVDQSHLDAIVAEARAIVEVPWDPPHDRPGAGVPPFPPGYRASGVLLHITSLPFAYASAISDRARSSGWTAFTQPGRAGGKRCLV